MLGVGNECRTASGGRWVGLQTYEFLNMRLREVGDEADAE